MSPLRTPDKDFSTNGYRKVLDSVWRPKIGEEPFEEIIYMRLQRIAAAHVGVTVDQIRRDDDATKNPSDQRAKKRTKKTYNNIISVLRCAFEFGYKDHPESRATPD
jgi:hypothetical protein